MQVYAKSNQIPNVGFLLTRAQLEHPVQFDNEFYESITILERYRKKTGEIIQKILEDDNKLEYLVVSKNEDLVLNQVLNDRIADCVEMASSVGNWVLATASGMDFNGEYRSCLYSSKNPHLRNGNSVCLVADSNPDLYMINLSSLRKLEEFVTNEKFRLLDQAFEVATIVAGYANKMRSIYLPAFSAALNSSFLERAYDVVVSESKPLFMERLYNAEWQTSFGQIDFEFLETTSPVMQAPIPSESKVDLAKALEDVATGDIEMPDISIVVRTIFGRKYLLYRLLASIVRAKLDNQSLEVVLSSDLPKPKEPEWVEQIQDDFPQLNIVINRNKKGVYSRVNNMLGGIKAAQKEYVWFVDDDDYVDVYSFKTLKKAFNFSKPGLVFFDTSLHKEKWVESTSGARVLADSQPGKKYEGKNWIYLFSGVNQIPICGFIAQRELLLSGIDKFELKYDYSEDYVLLLLIIVLNKDPVELINETLVHVSLRDDGENTVTEVDRSKWVRDISNFLYDLQSEPKIASMGFWNLPLVRIKRNEGELKQKEIEHLRKIIDRKDREIRSLVLIQNEILSSSRK